MTAARLVGISGNIRRPSRTRALVEQIGNEVACRTIVNFRLYDIVDAGPGLGAAFTRDQLLPQAAAIASEIEKADALIVGSPVHRGSYTGLFKHLFDFIELAALANKPVILTATGGGQKHALVVEHQLRPLFGFFTAFALPTAIYASDQDFADYRLVDPGVLDRVSAAVDQLVGALEGSAVRRSKSRGIDGAAQRFQPANVTH